MGIYNRVAFTLFGRLGSELSILFPDLPEDLKRSGMKISTKEYLSIGLLSSFIFFLIETPPLSFIFGFLFKGTFVSLITAITFAAFLAVFIFYLFSKYPKTIVADRSRKIDSFLPFATLYLSTVAGTDLPLDRVFKVFSKYSKYGEVTNQIKMINSDMDLFGLDIHTALQRAVDRAPSRKLKEMLYGLLSTSISGGDIGIYLREKSKAQMEDYRRSINEFSKRITLFIEIYLTAIVLGAVFFIVLTALFSGIAGVGGNILLLQSLIIFLFLPLISIAFVILIRLTSPTGE